MMNVSKELYQNYLKINLGLHINGLVILILQLPEYIMFHHSVKVLTIQICRMGIDSAYMVIRMIEFLN